MNGCIRSSLGSGLVVIGVSALVATSVSPPPPPARSEAPPIAFVAAPQPLSMTLAAVRPLPMTLAAAQPLPVTLAAALPVTLAAVSPLNLIAEQVGFHIGFVADFIGTGAVLFAREFAIPGTLLQDIQNGTPVPVAFGLALQSFANIELEAGARLVGFAAEYVSFQIQFLTSLVQNILTTVGNTTMAVVSALAPFGVGVGGQSVTSVATSAAPAVVVPTSRASDAARFRPSADTAVGRSHDPVGAASNSDASSALPKKPKLGVMTATVHGGDGATHPSAAVSESVSGDNAKRADDAGGQHRKHEAKPKGDNTNR